MLFRYFLVRATKTAIGYFTNVPYKFADPDLEREHPCTGWRNGNCNSAVPFPLLDITIDYITHNLVTNNASPLKGTSSTRKKLTIK